MKFNTAIAFAILLAGLFCCKSEKYPYPQNRKIADANGKVRDSLGFYFTVFDPKDSSQFTMVKDSFFENYLSSCLYLFKEPVLFNDYLGRKVYRFLWLGSFDLPMVLILANDKGTVTLRTKKLDRTPLFHDYSYGPPDPVKDSQYRAEGYVLNREKIIYKGREQEYTKIKADRRANIIYDSTKTFSLKEWNRFEELLNEAKFGSLKAYDWAGDADGAAWIIEAHAEDRYRYIVRQSPSGKIEEAGKFLVGLSGLKESIY